MISKITTSEFLASSCHRCSFYSRTRLLARVFCFRSLCASCEVRGSKARAASRIDRCLAHAHPRTATTPCTAAFDVIDATFVPSGRSLLQDNRPEMAGSGGSGGKTFNLFYYTKLSSLLESDSSLLILKTNLHEAFSINHDFYRSFSVGFHFFSVDFRISIVNQWFTKYIKYKFNPLIV